MSSPFFSEVDDSDSPTGGNILCHRIRCKYPHNTKALCQLPPAKGVINAVPPLFAARTHVPHPAASLRLPAKSYPVTGIKRGNLLSRLLPLSETACHRCGIPLADIDALGSPARKLPSTSLPLGSLPASGFLYNTCLPCILHRKAQIPTSITQTAALSGKGSCVLLFVIAFILS